MYQKKPLEDGYNGSLNTNRLLVSLNPNIWSDPKESYHEGMKMKHIHVDDIIGTLILLNLACTRRLQLLEKSNVCG